MDWVTNSRFCNSLLLWFRAIWGPFIERQDARIKIAHAKAYTATDQYVSAVEAECPTETRKALLLKMTQFMRRYFNLVEREVLNCDGLTGDAYLRWKQEWIVSANRVLSGGIRHLKLIRRERTKLALPKTLFEPSEGTLRNIQSFLAATSPAEATLLRRAYSDARLPFSGFDSPYVATSKKRKNTMKTETKIAVSSGIIFICMLLIIAVAIPHPTDFQYTVFRIVLALAAAAFASVIPGILNIRLSNWITAGGALAVFVIVYFYSPANLVRQGVTDPPSSSVVSPKSVK